MNKTQPIYPHGGLEAIAEGVYVVRGSIKLNPLVRITRNMVVVQGEGGVTLIHAVRVNEETEQAICALGDIKYVLRLGAMHGVDDPYYVERFGAKFCCAPGGTAYPGPDIDVPLKEMLDLAITDAELFEFSGSKQPEAALLVRRGSGLLITCDAIQHYGDFSYNNTLAKLLMPFLGFKKTTLIGPIWLKAMTPEDASLQEEFERLVELPFDSLIAAHGTHLVSGAKDSVRAAIGRAYSVQ